MIRSKRSSTTRASHERYVVYKQPIYADLSALATLASYFREVFYTYPYVDFISAEPESGKTTALKVMVFTGYYGTVASSFTEPLMFREIDDAHCFYGLDNVERLFGRGEDYQSIIDWLNSSYSRDIPCKRLEKVDDRWIVRYFDGYGIKAFTHIRDFPAKHRALKSRTIPVVMQPGNPAAYYPTPEKFRDLRDKCYKARLKEHENVKREYENLIARNVLTGRLGDLYLPLLAIAKLVDEDLFMRVLAFAKSEGTERMEFDEYNIAIIEVLDEYCLYGTHASQDIKRHVEDKLREKGILRDDGQLTTKQVTNRLKRLGFKRDPKRTDNKTWFAITERQVSAKMSEYNLTLDTPEIANFSNFSNSDEGFEDNKEGSKERGLTKKQSIEEIESETRGVRKNEKNEENEVIPRGKDTNKNVCDRCGEDTETTSCKGELLCEQCLNIKVSRDSAAGKLWQSTRALKIDETAEREDLRVCESCKEELFQEKKAREARKRLEDEGIL